MHFNPQLFKVSIIQTKLFCPLDFELSRFHCIYTGSTLHRHVNVVLTMKPTSIDDRLTKCFRSKPKTRAPHAGANARLQFLLEIYRIFNKNSKSKKGHNCAKNILRVTSPIGMSSPFHNEELVLVNIFSNDRDITKCPSFCTTTTTQTQTKKGHNCAKNILRVTFPIGMSFPFHNEQLVRVSSKYLQ